MTLGEYRVLIAFQRVAGEALFLTLYRQQQRVAGLVLGVF
jgi:hypothetical protein